MGGLEVMMPKQGHSGTFVSHRGEMSKFSLSLNLPKPQSFWGTIQKDQLPRRFIKLTRPSAYTLHSNPIPPADGTNGLL